MHKANISRYFIIFFLVVFSLLAIFPLLWLLDFSLCKSGDFFVSGLLKIPDPPQFSNYLDAWVAGKIPMYLANSVIITFMTVALTVTFSLMLGYAFTRMKWKISNLAKGFILLGMMIPIEATLLPNYIIFSKIGLTDSYFGLILPYVAFNLPIGVFIISGFLQSFPRSIEESAVIDGCGIFGIIMKFIVPLSMPALVTIVVFSFVSNWNEFIMMLTFISKDSLRTLQFSIMRFAGKYTSNYAVQFAIMMMMTIPSLIIYLIFNRQITNGVMMGAIKG